MHNDGFTYEDGRVLCCDAFSATGLVKHGFSTKKKGTSTGIFSSLNLGVHTKDQQDNVEQNFSLFCGDVSIDSEHLVLSQQVHGTAIHCATKEDCGKGLYRESDLSGIDGLVTNEQGVALATFYADCTPILFLDPKQKVIASVHSGWRGTVQKIAQRAAMVMMREYGCKSEHILVAMGPSIKQCHFEVDENVYLEFLLHFRGMAEKSTIKKNGKYYIDTDALNVYSLLQMGILPEHISNCQLCTYCHEELFFSHRREGETGRMCAVIELQ